MLNLTKFKFKNKSINFISGGVFKKNKSNASKLIYTEPLDIRQILTVTPARAVPEHIERPDYMRSNYVAPKKERSIVKDPQDLLNFKYACKVAAGAVKLGMESAKEGLSTDDIDRIIHEFIIKHDAYPSAIGYMGFPKSLCTSVNETVCHGIPNGRKLKNGDYINMDVTVYYKGFHGDTSGMALIGEVHPDIKKLINITRESMFKAIAICKPGVKVSKIGEVIQDFVEQHGYTSCAEFAGHGVGKQLHMRPCILHTHGNTDPDVMEEGMAFTIEPIVMLNCYDQLYMWEDDWTIICQDNPSAQWEHTILITKDGFEILTLREGEVLLL